eukprot:2410452-Rhodomonas_salina.3
MAVRRGAVQQVSVRTLQIVKFTLVIFLSAHWVGCVFFFLSRYSSTPRAVLRYNPSRALYNSITCSRSKQHTAPARDHVRCHGAARTRANVR